MQLLQTTRIDFIGKRKFFYILSAVITIAGLAAALVRGVEYGIDFEGGTEAAFEFVRPVEITEVRDAVQAGGFEGAEIKSYGADNQVLIRVLNPDQEAAIAGTASVTKISDRLRDELVKAFPGNDVTLLKVDNIGPKIGAELRNDALMAMAVSILAILLFITFRYEFLLGLGAIIALIHDVLVAFAFAVIFNGLFGLNLEMNQGMLAAFLTVVGFSINDKVINFDRIRENKTLHRGENMMMLINRSINETLPRTMLTGFCVILVLLILLFFSGEVLRGFAFTMLIGLITGTYSSIYIAGAFVVDAMIFQGKLDPKAERDFAAEQQKIQSERKPAGAHV
jgi:preprotein translocase SecF subunit